jgi:hypothetical protein
MDPGGGMAGPPAGGPMAPPAPAPGMSGPHLMQ